MALPVPSAPRPRHPTWSPHGRADLRGWLSPRRWVCVAEPAGQGSRRACLLLQGRQAAARSPILPPEATLTHPGPGPAPVGRQLVARPEVGGWSAAAWSGAVPPGEGDDEAGGISRDPGRRGSTLAVKVTSLAA